MDVVLLIGRMSRLFAAQIWTAISNFWGSRVNWRLWLELLTYPEQGVTTWNSLKNSIWRHIPALRTQGCWNVTSLFYQENQVKRSITLARTCANNRWFVWPLVHPDSRQILSVLDCCSQKYTCLSDWNGWETQRLKKVKRPLIIYWIKRNVNF